MISITVKEVRSTAHLYQTIVQDVPAPCSLCLIVDKAQKRDVNGGSLIAVVISQRQSLLQAFIGLIRRQAFCKRTQRHDFNAPGSDSSAQMERGITKHPCSPDMI